MFDRHDICQSKSPFNRSVSNVWINVFEPKLIFFFEIIWIWSLIYCLICWNYKIKISWSKSANSNGTFGAMACFANPKSGPFNGFWMGVTVDFSIVLEKMDLNAWKCACRKVDSFIGCEMFMMNFRVQMIDTNAITFSNAYINNNSRHIRIIEGLMHTALTHGYCKYPEVDWLHFVVVEISLKNPNSFFFYVTHFE